MARRRSRTPHRQAKAVGALLVLAIAVVVLHWLWQHWGFLLAVGAIIGAWIYRKWQRRQAWLAAFRRSGITAIDEMSGRMFEQRLQVFFNDRGWNVHLTPTSGDFGADLVGTDNTGQRVVIQAKRYQGSVGVHAIQEALGGRAHHNASRTLVITNSAFTVNARTLADQAGVELWDRTRLIQELAALPQATQQH